MTFFISVAYELRLQAYMIGRSLHSCLLTNTFALPISCTPHHGLPGGSRTPLSLRPRPLLSDSSSGSGVCTRKYSTSPSLPLLLPLLLSHAAVCPATCCAAACCVVGLSKSSAGPAGKLLPLYQLLLRGLLVLLLMPAAAVCCVRRRTPSCSWRGRLMQPA
jgi:hypothetical protein